MKQASRYVHLVGSIPLESAAEVFETVGRILGDRARRIPDGETGERTNWIAWQRKVLASHPQLQQIETNPPAPFPVFALKSGVEGPIAFEGRLGYADAARTAWEAFQRARDEGKIPQHARFQVSLPTPFAVVGQYVEQGSQAAVEPAYKARLFAELDEIVSTIPHDRLAIQWDVAIEFAVLEGLRRVYFAPVRDGLIERFVENAERVPAAVEMGFHLCYGDSGHKHFKEPEDMRHLVDVSNALSERISRPIHWIHMPVPRARSDDAYFAPLKDLRLRPPTELYLGLVHMTDGVPGAQARMASAEKVVSDFGIATECGFGRRPPETAPELLKIHKDLSD